MTVDVVPWNRTKNRFLLHHHLAMSLEVVVKTRLILQEDFLLLLGLSCPGLRWMFSEPDLFQIIRLFHLRSGAFFHHFGALTLPSHWVSAWISDASILSNSSEEYSSEDFLAELMQSRRVFGRNRVILDHRTKRNYWSFERFAESPFIGCFHIRQEI